jgi:hypothetical protein
MAEQLRRCEVGVALDEHERDALLGGDRPQQRALAGTGRSFEDDVAPGRHRREREPKLPLAADEVRGDPLPGRGDCGPGGPGV